MGHIKETKMEIIKKEYKLITYTAILIISLTLTFQFFHFAEHFIQVSVWVGGAKEKAYMSPVGMWTMEQVGAHLFPNLPMKQQEKLGFEFLHLIGNAIFLVGIIGLFYFIKNSKKLLWAFVIETFHLIEHILLSLSALYIEKSIGFSTMFGLPMSPLFSVGYRVWWHFIFNLIPTALVILVLLGLKKEHTKRLQKYNN